MNKTIQLEFNDRLIDVEIDDYESILNEYGCIDYVRLYKKLADKELEGIKAFYGSGSILNVIQGKINVLIKEERELIESRREQIDDIKVSPRLTEQDRIRLSEIAFKLQMLTNAYIIQQGGSSAEIALISHLDEARWKKEGLVVITSNALRENRKSKEDVEKEYFVSMEALSAMKNEISLYNEYLYQTFDLLSTRKMLPKYSYFNANIALSFYGESGLKIPQKYKAAMHKIVEKSGNTAQSVYDVVIAGFCCGWYGRTPAFKIIQEEFNLTPELNAGNYSKIVAYMIKKIKDPLSHASNKEDIVRKYIDIKEKRPCTYNFYNYYMELLRVNDKK